MIQVNSTGSIQLSHSSHQGCGSGAADACAADACAAAAAAAAAGAADGRAHGAAQPMRGVVRIKGHQHKKKKIYI